MKKVIIGISATILIFAIFISCDKVETVKFRSYVTTYYDWNSILLKDTEEGDILIYGSGGSFYCGWKSQGSEKDKYDNLCRLHNDMSYHTKRRFIAFPDWGEHYKNDITKIDIVSNADFDSEHKAGTSLSDIVRFLSVSPIKFIESGYKQTYDWDNNYPDNFKASSAINYVSVSNIEDQKCYHPIDKIVSELSSSDLILLGNGWVGNFGILVFDKQPDLEKEHELTVTVSVSNNRVFMPKIIKVFE